MRACDCLEIFHVGSVLTDAGATNENEERDELTGLQRQNANDTQVSVR